ncbi:MAG: spore coat associated protein CotJA [Lachnospiraceae bacterium]|nr:spore coat associated protein CotJA [Lachnospiraceae bacterium]
MKDCNKDTFPPFHQPFIPADYPLGMAYVPRQSFRGICENLEAGYNMGTIFPELNKPFTGRRCVK